MESRHKRSGGCALYAEKSNHIWRCETHYQKVDTSLEKEAPLMVIKRLRAALELIANPEITPEMEQRLSEGTSMVRIYEDIAYEALKITGR